ncbi:MAG: sensor histidine kinase [Anaerolineae bacterium]|nr:sensor histidine kinase [Anaerolineae bacterium]
MYNLSMFIKAKDLWQRNWKLLGNGYGFFIFLVLVISGILGYTLVQNIARFTPFQILLFIVASIAHLALHWFSSLFFETPKGNIILLITQSILSLIIASITGRFEIIFAIFAAMIGSVSGTSLKLRTKSLSILWYAALLTFSAYAFSEDGFLDLWWAAILSTTFIIFIFTIAFHMQNQAQERSEKLLHELSEAHSELADYAEQVETLTLDNERQRIARELHDTLAQGLAGLILNMEAVSSQITRENDFRAQEILQQTMKDARSTLTEARQVIDGLRSMEQGDVDFGTQLKVTAAHFEASARIPCEVLISTGLTLSSSLQKQIMRIVNEALSNISKHAKAEKVKIIFSLVGDDCHLEVADDGQGFLPKNAQEKEGSYGLLGIQERVDLLDGTLRIDSQPGAGTKIKIFIPIAGQHE